jgi:arylsulfatase A-like enzyme
MKFRFLLTLLLALGLLPNLLSAADRPNILFIAIDDLNDWTGSMGGNAQSVTPNLDRLAASGVLFTNAHCAAPACNPSRAALMTGIRPSTSGVYQNSQPWRKSAVLAKTKTLPQWLMEHGGYSARASGKIYHGSFPDAASWQEYWPSQQQNKPGDPKPDKLPVNGIPKTSHFDWGPVQAPDDEMGDWQVAEWIGERLQEESDQPFFLACGFYRPHLPWFAPQKYFDKFPLDSIDLPVSPDDDLDDVPPAGVKMAKPDGDHAKVLEHDQWKQAVQGYLASINFVDTCLGKVLDSLEKSPHADDTIVVLWSDHGWHLGEKKHWRKFALWEEATRVQMMWRVPGVTNAGGKCAAPVNLLDIYPTLLDLAGVKENPATEGVSLRPLLADPSADWDRPTLTTHGRNNHAIRGDRYRYIRYEDGGEELYDHRNDPMEHRNLAGEESLVEVKAGLAKWLPEQNAPNDPPLGGGKAKKKKE